MDIRELKKEVGKLEPINSTIDKFQQSWLKPFNKNSPRLALLNQVPTESRVILNKKLVVAQQHLQEIKKSQTINERMHYLSSYLVQLKLTALQGDPKKAKVIAKQLMNDEFVNPSQLFSDVKQFEEKVQQLHQQYEEINSLLHQHLSLEEALFYLELPHYMYLRNLMQMAKRQKMVVRDLSRHLISLTAQSPWKSQSR